MAAMNQRSRPADPLSGTELLLVDASNLVHALARTSGAPPAAALVARIRNLVPATIAIELVFDGPVEPGMGRVRVATGVDVRYSGRQTADEVIVARVGAEAAVGGPLVTGAILVISDDRGLRDLVRARGARTAGASWLGSRLAGSRGPDRGTTGARGSRRTSGDVTARRPDRGQATGQGAPPAASAGRGRDGEGDDREADSPRWRGGRGATVKRGNPRRAGRSARPHGST